jgi:protein SCO1/2
MPKPTHRYDVRVLVLALIAVAAGAFVLLRLGVQDIGQPESEAMPHEAMSQEAMSRGAAIGGPFTLLDQDGNTRSDADFRGKLMLVYFGYTFCPDVCPLALSTMAAAVDALGDKASEAVPLFVTVDPDRDTPARLKEYMAKFGPRLVALTGSADALAQTAKAYHVYYGIPAEKEGAAHVMDHSSIIFLMGRDGKYLTHFTMQTSAQEMSAKIAEHL